MRRVIALGGNALLRRGQMASADNQRQALAAAAPALARACDGHQVALVHGNGPQIGLLALEAAAYEAVPAYPLDVLGAQSQGMIGYMIAQALDEVRPAREVVVVLTRTLVDRGDPAFGRVTKPIGPVYSHADGAALSAARGWSFAPDGAGLRRVVASPEPLEIVETPALARLMAAGAITICAGGGGVPVTREAAGPLRGIEAVIDKDLAAALLATRLDADELIILTDVDAVYLDWGTARARPLKEIHAEDLAHLKFADGTMGPKVEAACRFATQTGRPVLIGALGEIDRLLSRDRGTRVIA